MDCHNGTKSIARREKWRDTTASNNRVLALRLIIAYIDYESEKPRPAQNMKIPSVIPSKRHRLFVNERRRIRD